MATVLATGPRGTGSGSDTLQYTTFATAPCLSRSGSACAQAVQSAVRKQQTFGLGRIVILLLIFSEAFGGILQSVVLNRRGA